MLQHRVRSAVMLAICMPTLLAAQVEVGSPAWRHLAADSATKLLLEHRFLMGSTDSALVTLVKDGYYWMELTGSSVLPAVRPAGRGWEALVVPLDANGHDGATLFELHPAAGGLHAVTLSLAPSDSAALLRLYSHEGEARNQRAMRDAEWGVGLALGAGWHSGYRLAPSTGAAPRGGSDLEGLLLIESGRGLGIGLGIARQSLPDAGHAVTWYFLEPRVRLLSRKALGTSMTDVWVLARVGQARSTPAPSIDPSLLGAGLQVRQYLSGAERRRGWSLVAGYFHGRVGGIPEEALRSMDRLSAGLTWVP
jgi:hypothetical protein